MEPKSIMRALRTLTLAGLGLASLCVAQGQAAQPDSLETLRACAGHHDSAEGLFSSERKIGWQTVAPADLDETGLALNAYGSLVSEFVPGVPQLPARWAGAWDMEWKASQGLRRLKPANGPDLYRRFMVADGELLRLNVALPTRFGDRTLVSCKIVVSGKAALPFADLPLPSAQGFSGGEPLHLAGMDPVSLYRFQPSMISALVGRETLAVQPDLVAVLMLDSQFDAKWRKQ